VRILSLCGRFATSTLGDPDGMARVEEPGGNVWRLTGRGREDTTPLYLHFGVLTAVAIVVGLIVGLVFLAQALA
jgi:hypothetical protein